jgi:hypothetical protein
MSPHQNLGQNLNLGIYLECLGLISTIQNFILEEIMGRLRPGMLDTISLQTSRLLPKKKKEKMFKCM